MLQLIGIKPKFRMTRKIVLSLSTTFVLPEIIFNRYKELAHQDLTDCSQIPRDNSFLVQAVEEYPDIAKSSLQIVEIPIYNKWAVVAHKHKEEVHVYTTAW